MWTTRGPRFLAPTGLLVATLGVSAMTVQAVGALEGTSGRPVTAQGDEAPAWITLESAGLDSEPISPEGLTPQGTINPAAGEAIWFVGHDRVIPGQLGTAVIAGHETYYQQPDVFHDLDEATEGDVLTIGYGDGQTREFVIRSTSQVSKEGLQRSQEVWGDQDDVARIALITCDPSLGQREDGHQRANFVAIAEEVIP